MRLNLRDLTATTGRWPCKRRHYDTTHLAPSNRDDRYETEFSNLSRCLCVVGIEKMLRILCRQDEIKVTCRVWNRGQCPRLWAVERTAHADITETASLHLLQDHQDNTLHIRVLMDSSPNDPDWSLVSSGEDCTFAPDYDVTPCPVEGAASQPWNAPTPALYTDSQGQPRWSRSASLSILEPQTQGLGFVQMTDCNPDAAYDKEPPRYIHYRIDWRLMINKSVASRNTIEDIVLQPTSYGPRVLLPRLEEVLKRKVLPPRSVRPSETDIEIKVTQRSEDDFAAQYAKTDVNWLEVESKLLKWSELFRKGKKLRVNICFRYVETTTETGPNFTNANGKRARGSASEQQRAELIDEVNGEEALTGRPAAWQSMYRLFHCPGPPCDLRPWCWFDSQKNKRFELKTHHLRTLIRRKGSGVVIESHEDMPEDLREQIYREAEQNERRKQPHNTAPSSSVLPIQITNVLPGHTSAQAATMPKAEVSPVEFRGFRDERLKDYGNWLQSTIRDPSWKAGFQKATDCLVRKCIDLQLLFEEKDPDPRWLADEAGVEIDIAKRFYRDIKHFHKRCKLDHADAQQGERIP